jgi:sugar phosphate isomerase/epimerase
LIQIACSTRCFPREPLTGALSRVGWAGFRAAEVVIEPGAQPSEEALGARLKAEDLALVSLDAGEVAASSPEAALEAAAHLGRCAVAAYRLGAGRVVFTTGSGLSAPPDGVGSIEPLAYALSRLARALREIPVALCVRPMPGTAVPSAEALAELCRAADAAAPAGEPEKPASRLGLALDPAAVALGGGDPERILRSALESAVPARLEQVYLTDARAGATVLPGEGELDWRSLSAALLSGGYHGPVTVSLVEGDPLFAEIDAREAAAFAQVLFPDGLYAPDDGR